CGHALPRAAPLRRAHLYKGRARERAHAPDSRALRLAGTPAARRSGVRTTPGFPARRRRARAQRDRKFSPAGAARGSSRVRVRGRTGDRGSAAACGFPRAAGRAGEHDAMSVAWLRAEWNAPPTVVAGTTYRRGGASRGAWESLNLASHVGDDPAAVAQNRRRFARACGLPSEPPWLEEVHG